ncbi:type II toxin-antitoxin system death-on-curing family toxin [Paenisporosarcina antarctica]|uniref:Type II toxin-antitoxin system death-on-curing family toxin n=1 Tax=Paenisporosarcina antarctica TaxID=417367 RepID=A0A4P6ZZ27_9BACL|nr:Fic family protein [Paenisporosarcina antarctica]QBP41990.1 type II toxin-antitoxin system death-on-curing family toxin [Paenisporosarcina antarctica]
MEAYILKTHDILMLHEYVMSETHDSNNAGVKFQGSFYSMLERPRTKLLGLEQFPSIVEKACVYLHAISTDHIFSTGNQKTAAYVFLTYLDLHGLTLKMTSKKFEEYVVELPIHQNYKGDDAIQNICQDLREFIVKH